MSISSIGRVKTVLVSGEGPATVTTLTAQKITSDDNDRLVFSGSVKFDQQGKQQLNKIVLPQVDQILIALGQSFDCYELSITNPGATSSSDLQLNITGFSIDVAAFMALLSVSLNIPIKQDIAFTGHLSSKSGDISPVKSLPAKCVAVLEDGNINEFVYPDLNMDISLKKSNLKSIVNQLHQSGVYEDGSDCMKLVVHMNCYPVHCQLSP